MFEIILGITTGIILPLQTAISVKLRKTLGTPLRAALATFFVAAIFLGLILIMSDHTLLISSTVISKQPWWIWIGGFLGVIYVTGNIILFPKLGSVQTVIMPVLGQIIMSMFIDNFGWFGLTQHSFDWIRAISSLLILSGISLAVLVDQRLEKKQNRKISEKLPWQLCGVLLGICNATQTGINGHLGSVIGSPIQATFISFVFGTLTLLILTFIKDRSLSIKNGLKSGQPWWVWTSGLFGSMFILGNTFLSPKIGTGLTVSVVLFGQIAGSLLIEKFGWLEAQKKAISKTKILGLAIMFIGVILIKLV
ncbi:DMT family transporter [Liquorilactobacillus uvarum]|uniref:DMT family transporter n=1 Tax=Liquorilactobacillus uvarum TaxID=303240 RepID=UPI0028891E3E|nr:DMT family transporter [Liquorilactobacillus uvarum]